MQWPRRASERACGAAPQQHCIPLWCIDSSAPSRFPLVPPPSSSSSSSASSSSSFFYLRLTLTCTSLELVVFFFFLRCFLALPPVGTGATASRHNTTFLSSVYPRSMHFSFFTSWHLSRPGQVPFSLPANVFTFHCTEAISLSRNIDKHQ